MNTLIINSYAGSIVLGAIHLGQRVNIIGSWEDTGYGHDVQKLNIAESRVGRYISHRKDWPATIDLSDTLVVAHPPCSAFSTMTAGRKQYAGLAAEAFGCTVRLLNYTMKNKAAGICVESVQRTMDGARAIHEALANQHGYSIYRVLQNAATFGSPQWRPRFWAIFVRKDLDRGEMTFSLVPRVKTVGDILENGNKWAMLNKDEPLPSQARGLETLLQRAGDWDSTRVTLPEEPTFNSHNYLFHALTGVYGDGLLSNILSQQSPGKSGEWWRRSPIFRSRFASGLPRLIHPKTTAGAVLLGSSIFLSKPTLGHERAYRLFRKSDYKEYMGFPRGYQFKSDAKMLENLSKGVVPAVASWIIATAVNNLAGNKLEEKEGAMTTTIKPGEVADMQQGTILLRRGTEVSNESVR